MQTRMRVCLVINSLRCGGAERVAATLANEWTRVGHDTSLVTLAAAELDFYGLDHRIDRRGLDVMVPSTGFFGGIVGECLLVSVACGGSSERFVRT